MVVVVRQVFKPPTSQHLTTVLPFRENLMASGSCFVIVFFLFIFVVGFFSLLLLLLFLCLLI